MSDLNRWYGIGRLTRDPELKYTQGGASVASFSIASSYTYTKDGAKKETTSFFNCVAWAKTGEIIAQYVKKGHRIAIEGRLQQRSWDGSDGNKRTAVEIVVENFNFIERAEKGATDAAAAKVADAFGEGDVGF
jgi:single-strand DNA-binding protein